MSVWEASRKPGTVCYFTSASPVATTSEQTVRANILQCSYSHQTPLVITRNLAWLGHPSLSQCWLLPGPWGPLQAGFPGKQALERLWWAGSSRRSWRRTLVEWAEGSLGSKFASHITLHSLRKNSVFLLFSYSHHLTLVTECVWFLHQANLWHQLGVL